MKKNNKSIHDLLIEGMRHAERKAIEKAIETNTPLIVWKNEEITEIPPELLKEELKKWDHPES